MFSISLVIRSDPFLRGLMFHASASADDPSGSIYILQRERNNFLVSSAAAKDEERKRTGLSQSFLDTRRSFYLSFSLSSTGETAG